MGAKREISREKIITETHRLIVKQGYKKTTLRQIAEACDMSKGNVSYHFKTKDDIMLALGQDFFLKVNTAAHDTYCSIDDEILKLLLYQLSVFYITQHGETTYHFTAEVSGCENYLTWRAQYLLKYLIPAFMKQGICFNKDEFVEPCFFAVYGLYGMIKKAYFHNETFDGNATFILFMRALFAQIQFHQGDEYIEKALRIFAETDKLELMAKIQLSQWD